MRNLGNTRIGLWVVLAMVGAMGGSVLADIALPNPEPAPDPGPALKGVMPMKVIAEGDKDLPVMRLVISSNAAKQLGLGDNSEKKPQADAGEETGASWRTAIAGVSISAALMLGGIAFFRSGGGSKSKTMLLLAAAGSLTVGGFVASSYANAPPPRDWPRPDPNVAIQIVVSDDANGIELHTTEQQMQRLVRAYGAAAQKKK